MEHKLLRKARECQHKVYFSSELAEEIDEMLTAGMLAAEKQCRIFYRLPWDKEVDAVITAYNIVRTHFSCLRCNSPLPKTIDAKMNRLDEPFELPPTIKETDKLLDKLYKQ